MIDINNIFEALRTYNALEDEIPYTNSHTFYLMGSRAHTKTIKDSTDWDYYTNFSEDIVQILMNNGFQEAPAVLYKDSMTETIFQKYDDSGVIKVDVQLIKEEYMTVKHTLEGLIDELTICGLWYNNVNKTERARYYRNLADNLVSIQNTKDSEAKLLNMLKGIDGQDF